MPEPIYKAVPTEVGLEKIQQAIWTQTKLPITTLIYGDGVLDINTMYKRTSLINPLGSTGVDSIVINPDDNTTWIKAIIGASLPSGIIREIGLVDNENNLCFIANTPDIYKVETSEGTLIDIPIEFGIKNSYAEYIEIPIDPTVYASKVWVNNNFAHRSLDNITAAGKNVIYNIAYGPIIYYEYGTIEFELPFDEETEVIPRAIWEDQGPVDPDNPNHEVPNGR